MINAVYGVKQFQANLPKITRQIAFEGGHYLVTKRNKPALVAIPFEYYQYIEDILQEVNSPKLKLEVGEGREEYRVGETKTLDEVLK